MIQRVQSLYLLGSILICILIYFLPLGYVNADILMKYNVCGFFDVENGDIVQSNWLLSSVLALSILLQLVGIFLFRNRNKQAMIVQVSLISLLLFVVLALLYQDICEFFENCFLGEEEITFTWNSFLIGVSWVLTYLALRAIKKDEVLIRSADRMR